MEQGWGIIILMSRDTEVLACAVMQLSCSVLVSVKCGFVEQMDVFEHMRVMGGESIVATANGEMAVDFSQG